MSEQRAAHEEKQSTSGEEVRRSSWEDIGFQVTRACHGEGQVPQRS